MQDVDQIGIPVSSEGGLSRYEIAVEGGTIHVLLTKTIDGGNRSLSSVFVPAVAVAAAPADDALAAEAVDRERTTRPTGAASRSHKPGDHG